MDHKPNRYALFILSFLIYPVVYADAVLKGSTSTPARMAPCRRSPTVKSCSIWQTSISSLMGGLL